MNDRELLELAARAAGVRHVDYADIDYDGSQGLMRVDDNGRHLHAWNPLEDDGDALRLAITLRLDLTFYNGFQEVHSESSRSDGLSPLIEPYGGDAGAATRRAIVRAAAEIGRAMP